MTTGYTDRLAKKDEKVALGGPDGLGSSKNASFFVDVFNPIFCHPFFLQYYSSSSNWMKNEKFIFAFEKVEFFIGNDILNNFFIWPLFYFVYELKVFDLNKAVDDVYSNRKYVYVAENHPIFSDQLNR